MSTTLHYSSCPALKFPRGECACSKTVAPPPRTAQEILIRLAEMANNANCTDFEALHSEWDGLVVEYLKLTDPVAAVLYDAIRERARAWVCA